jgi:hypothetical protein
VYVPHDYDSATGEVTNLSPAFSAFKSRPTLIRNR